MKKSNLILTGTLALSLCAAMLTGCGKDTPPTTVPPTTVPTTVQTQPTVAPTEIPTEAPTEASAPTEVPVSLFGSTDFPISLTYSSGAGGWRTELVLHGDGSFRGRYSDSELGETGTDYPGGTIYYCNFKGSFSHIRRLDDHSFALTASDLGYDAKLGDSRIENGVRYLAAEAPGVSDGTEFILYTPEAPTSVLSEAAQSSWPGNLENPRPQVLNCWALYNTDSDSTFFYYDYSAK